MMMYEYEEVSVRGFKEELMPTIKSVLRAAESNRIDLSYWVNWGEDLKGGYFTRPKMKGGDLYTLKIYKDERGWYKLYLENLYEKCKVYDEDGNWSYDDDKWDQLFEEDPVEEDEDYKWEGHEEVIKVIDDVKAVNKSILRAAEHNKISLMHWLNMGEDRKGGYFSRPKYREGVKYILTVYRDEKGLYTMYVSPLSETFDDESEEDEEIID